MEGLDETQFDPPFPAAGSFVAAAAAAAAAVAVALPLPPSNTGAAN